MTEQFTTIPAYPNYEVSELGNIRRKDSDRNLSPVDNGKGYKSVPLYRDKKKRICLIHRIVLSTFKPIEEKKDVNHIDGDKSNNALSNLEWVTKSENTRHAHLTGLFASRSKLTIDDVKEIKKLVKEAERLSYVAIGNQFGVKGSIISKIANGHLYGYVEEV